MAIEVIGPPAVGKTTFLAALDSSVVTVSEPLLELNEAGRLPAPGLGRQKAVLHHVLAQLPPRGHGRVLVDSGVLYLLAFARLHFLADPGIVDLFDEAAASARSRDLGFFGVVELNAPMNVLEQHKDSDQSRARGHFHENVLAHAEISTLVRKVVDAIDPALFFAVSNTSVPDEMHAACSWVLSRSRQIRLDEVIAAAKQLWIEDPKN